MSQLGQQETHAPQQNMISQAMCEATAATFDHVLAVKTPGDSHYTSVSSERSLRCTRAFDGNDRLFCDFYS